MKKYLALVLFTVICNVAAFAQGTTGINYQAVARNLNGTVINNKNIQVRFTVTAGNTTTIQYQETQNAVTNAYGLFNVVIGKGVPVTGTFLSVPWATANQWLQVEVAVDGGAMNNLGKNPLYAVPYAVMASQAIPAGPAGGDLSGTYPNPGINIPLIKTSAQAGNTLINVTNSATTGFLGAVQGTSASTDANAVALQGTISSATPGGFSSAVRGINNGTGGLGIGVYGSQAGSGWGVYGTTPNGIGVHGNSTNGFGVYGLSTTGTGIYGNSANGQPAVFDITNNANTNNTLSATTNGSGSAIVGNNTATTGIKASIAGSSASLDGNAIGISGTITSTAPGGFSAGVRGINNGTGGLGIGVWGSQAGSGWGVYGTAAGGIGVNGSASSGIGVNGTANTGTGGRFTTTSGLAIYTTGALRLAGIGEAAGRVLTSDASGNATWQPLGATGITGSGTLNQLPKFTPSGSQLGNSQIFDDGNNVGINTLTPTHKLHVEHSGSTGILSKSTGSFSVVDIDAASGDAALRFANAGVNQWNFRNRPGDNYLEWFELGGGGSRMVIQDGTGNVGIGETANPTYRLDVLHGGATGIRSKSSASFSVIDIDGASGDAALRFANAGVNQWNFRNRPADNYLEWFELGGGGSRMVIQDGTGNVGIGETTNPTYRLDVLHGGATGIRSKSSASFSVIDIDGASGDAALRFANAGVNQWNFRNRPADNYLEWFELGGGGSRMVIQDGTGNVGIGETTNPTYRLDVLHGGATGIRSRSSSTFSVIDIDGANGDAALRFANAGVNQWNLRNRPSDNYLELFELGGGGSRLVVQNATGNVGINFDNPTAKLHVGGNFTATGVKAFTIDHPLDPENKMLRHFAVESNEVMNTYSGNVTTDANGKVIVKLPDYFESINKDFRYQLTVIGSFAQAIISKKISNNQFEIATNQPNIEVSWEVKGVRNDGYMKNVNTMQAEEMKPASMRGKYIEPKAFNLPESRGVNYKPEAMKGEPNSITDAKTAPTKPVAAVIDNTGSVAPMPPAKPVAAKPMDVSGSVAPEVKKSESKKTVTKTEKGSTD